MTARDDILGYLRNTLARPELQFPPRDPQPLDVTTRMAVTHAEGTQQELAQRFGAELQRLHGTYQIVQSEPEARLAVIHKLMAWAEEEAAARKGAQLETRQERMVLSWDPALLPVPTLQEALTDLKFQLVTPTDLSSAEARNRVRYIRFGLTGVEAAFAATGSILVASGPQTSRVASLLPIRHLALIPFRRLYPSIEAWLYERRAAGKLVDLYRSRANLAMISGPSKSADIEMNLTLGVHGPKFVHAILFGSSD